MDFVERGMKLVPHPNKRITHAVHLNHRFTPEAEVARPLWLDAHLQRRLPFPQSPEAELVLTGEDGIPVYRVKPDTSRPIEKVHIYYGYERDPRNRFWTDARATTQEGVWEAPCPLLDLEEPLFAFANVHYKLAEHERQSGDPNHFILSVADAAYPEELQAAKVKATEGVHREMDDFSRGFHDWYTLNIQNPHHWLISTRKLVDPRWEAPRGAALSLEIETTHANNILSVELKTDTWRSYTGRKAETWSALVSLNKTGRQKVELSTRDFTNASGESMSDWYGITELIFQAGGKSKHSPTPIQPWEGEVPQFHDLRWVDGEPIRRPKPFMPLDSETRNPDEP